MNDLNSLHDLLDRALDDVQFPAGDVTAAIRTQVDVGRRRRRTRRAVGVVAGVALLVGALGSLPVLHHDRGAAPAKVPSAREDRFYPVGTLLPRDVAGLRVAVRSGPSHEPEPGPSQSATRGTYYSLERNGRPGYLLVITHDPARDPSTPGFYTNPKCPTPELPGFTCRSAVRPDRSVLKVSTARSQSQQEQGGPPWDGPSLDVTIVYPDHRVVVLSAITALDSPVQVTDPPLLTEAELVAMAGSQEWFAPDSVG
ncbi:hypothetical protein F4556_000558 [Kitasatospora gansuensis]|uniref:Uncharacterized protein n=1 Tax=Kitasatospora gansuensis TaxID=258050 RepID=A0A7W7S822_9ACTN|nr:hypothetical protein [Kitasatospora gansuensis]MBB4945023.1 hypothetical protein [Kitasatospora gansuensis]